MLDELAPQAAPLSNSWPVVRPGIGDTTIDLAAVETASSGSDPVEQTSREKKW